MANYETYNKVKEMLDSRRISARQEADRRSEEVRQASPEIAKIDEELSGTGLLIFKTACAGKDIEPLKQRNLALNSRRREVLKSLGYPEDYTEVKYTCSLCGDTGFIDIKMCKCFRELLTLEGIKASGMGNLIEEQSFDNFELSHYAGDGGNLLTMERAVKAAKEYAENFGRVGAVKNLLFMGKTGTGKTHLSTSIAKVVISKGYDVLYDTAQNIVSAFERDKFRSGYSQPESEGEKYLECDLLIMDDLGTEFSNQFTLSCLYNIFNTRRNRGLATIISTNLSAEELTSKYDGRIYSRIVGTDYKVVNFEGPDYRLFGLKGLRG